jgi:hypothetical protein
MSCRTLAGLARGRANGIVIVALLTVVGASAADFSGRWSGSSPDDKSVGTIYAVLKQDGMMLTGSAGPNESRQFPITTGKVDGDRLTFEAKMGGGRMRFDLTAAGSELKGTMRIIEDDNHTDSANIVLTRIPQ